MTAFLFMPTNSNHLLVSFRVQISVHAYQKLIHHVVLSLTLTRLFSALIQIMPYSLMLYLLYVIKFSFRDLIITYQHLIFSYLLHYFFPLLLIVTILIILPIYFNDQVLFLVYLIDFKDFSFYVIIVH